MPKAIKEALDRVIETKDIEIYRDALESENDGKCIKAQRLSFTRSIFE